MAEILLEGRDCEACGTEVRKGALFCYHCGMSVAPDVVVTTDTEKGKVSDAWFREDVTATVPKEEAITDYSEIVEETDESEIVEDADDSETVVDADETEIVEEDSEIIEEIDESEVVEEAEEAKIVEDEIVEDDSKVEDDESETEDDKRETEDKTTEIEEEADTEKEEKDEDAEKEEKPKLKTAAAMRRKPKRIQKKRVEIVWDEPQSPPNVWFLIATILFAILAVGLWFMAKYLG